MKASFAFVPRTQFAQPKAFGKNLRILAPAAGIDGSSPNYRAAILQHFLSFQIRDAIRATGSTLPQVLERMPGLTGSKERHERIFRGETMMQLADLMLWVHRFPGLRIEIADFFKPETGTGPGSPTL